MIEIPAQIRSACALVRFLQERLRVPYGATSIQTAIRILGVGVRVGEEGKWKRRVFTRDEIVKVIQYVTKMSPDLWMIEVNRRMLAAKRKEVEELEIVVRSVDEMTKIGDDYPIYVAIFRDGKNDHIFRSNTGNAAVSRMKESALAWVLPDEVSAYRFDHYDIGSEFDVHSPFPNETVVGAFTLQNNRMLWLRVSGGMWGLDASVFTPMIEVVSHKDIRTIRSAVAAMHPSALWRTWSIPVLLDRKTMEPVRQRPQVSHDSA